jgi:hypothetical protein
VEQVTYQGKQVIRVTDAMEPKLEGNEDRVVVLMANSAFRDGTIEAEIAGFVGIAFRVAPGASRYECFYLRPTNGRADNRVRRNQSVQYISFPELPWHRLRKEFPKKYETYADLVPGEWTKLRIEVNGDKARLYAGGVQQPTLIGF